MSASVAGTVTANTTATTTATTTTTSGTSGAKLADANQEQPKSLIKRTSVHAPLTSTPSISLSPASVPARGKSMQASIQISGLPMNHSVPSLVEGGEEEKQKRSGDCLWVKGVDAIEGEFEITSKAFYFRNLDQMVFRCIPIDQMTRVYRRNYMLRSLALEIFTKKQRSYFYVFDIFEVSKVTQVLTKLHPPHLEDYFSLSPAKLLRKSNITDLWRRRLISNFDYLMELNTIAGRTYNDLSQYPVFPWIIADYTSSTLDLNDPKVYRDLTKPIGAQNPARLAQVLERYNQMVEMSSSNDTPADPPPFMYGTHYSSAAVVLFYLVRLEPFTSYHVNLQDGIFDQPMRMFWSIPSTWQGCLTNMMDVKELIPEFFYNPAFLTNVNGFHLGHDKDGRDIGEVVLPPWAQRSPEAFVQINRRALESEYVSQNLHHWIDLIFGYKQTGESAISAHNLFYWLCYEGAVDIDAIEDPDERKAKAAQIINFGQTPVQLLITPHPPRCSSDEALKENMTIDWLGETLTDGLTNISQFATSAAQKVAKVSSPILSNFSSLTLSAVTSPPSHPRRKVSEKKQISQRELTSFREGKKETTEHEDVSKFKPYPGGDDRTCALIFVYPYKGDKLLLAFMDGTIVKTSWRVPTFPGIHPGRPKVMLHTPEWNTVQYLPFLFSHRVHSNRLHSNFAVLSDSQVLFSGGHWDDYIICSNLMTGTIINQISEHKDTVTCMALSEDGNTLATGSLDCTCLIWDASVFDPKSLSKEEMPKPRLILYGQDHAINCVDLSADLDLVTTGSDDGHCILYELSKGSYLRTLNHQEPVLIAKISTQGIVVTYCESINFNELYIHSINGKILNHTTTLCSLNCMIITEDGEYLISGGESGTIFVQSLYLFSLKVVQEWKCKAKITSLALTEQQKGHRYLLVGLDTGELRVIRFDLEKFRQF